MTPLSALLDFPRAGDPNAISHQGRSIWERTATAAPQSRALCGEVRADVVVVGGGVTGLSTALHLAEAGVSVALLEAGELGAGASGRSSGQIIPGLKRSRTQLNTQFGEAAASRLIEFGDHSAELVYQLVERHAIDCALERSGWIRAAHSTRAVRHLEAVARELQCRGHDVDLLSRAETSAMLGTDYYAGGLLDRRAGALQPTSYVRGLARTAIAKGARVFTRSPVTGIERLNGDWRLATPLGQLIAESVVLATGAYTTDLWPELRRSIVVVHSTQLASVPLPRELRPLVNPSGAVVSDTRKLVNFFRFDGDGRLIIGGRGPVGSQLGQATLDALLRVTHERFAVLADLRWECAWYGKIDLTTDDMPHLCKPAPGLWTIVGYGGRGLALGTALGAILSKKLVGGAEDVFDYPLSELTTIPFHGLRAPAIMAGIAYHRLRDSLGYAS